MRRQLKPLATALLLALFFAGACTGGVVRTGGYTPATSEGNLVGVYLDGQGIAVPVSFTLPEGVEATAEQAVRKLLEKPRVGDLYPPDFPPGTSLTCFSIQDGMALVDFSRELLGIAGGTSRTRTLVDSILFTVLMYPGIERVRVLIDGEEVRSFGDGGVDLTNLSYETWRYPNAFHEYPFPPATLFLPMSFGGRTYLVPVVKDVPQENALYALLEVLITGRLGDGRPFDVSLHALLPAGARINQLDREGQVLRVDFSREVESRFKGDSHLAKAFLDAVIFTATEYAGVEEVYITFAGKAKRDFRGIPLQIPARRPRYINPVEG